MDGLITNDSLSVSKAEWLPVSKDLEFFSLTPLPDYHVPMKPFAIALDSTQTMIVLFNTLTHKTLVLVRLNTNYTEDVITSVQVNRGSGDEGGVIVQFITSLKRNNLTRCYYNNLALNSASL